MAPVKRKANGAEAPATKEKRSKKDFERTASSARPSRTILIAASQPRSTRSSTSGALAKSANSTPTKTVKKGIGRLQKPSKKAPKAPKSGVTVTNGHRQANISVDVPGQKETASLFSNHEDEEEHDGPSYWLMKAEPESRIEKGKDVKFSIDDLKAAKEPEAWDGVRNAAARNNMRAMLKGDQAFFYHSNCKSPGIVGTMEIVQEHSVDESAFDQEHPYYDEKSTRANPKWCVVHVQFRQKFPKIIKLKELQRYAKDGGVLQSLQTLKQSRLSVSKVSKKEWCFIMGLVDDEDQAEAAKQHEPQMIS